MNTTLTPPNAHTDQSIYKPEKMTVASLEYSLWGLQNKLNTIQMYLDSNTSDMARLWVLEAKGHLEELMDLIKTEKQQK